MAVHKKYNKSVLGRGLDDLGNGRGLDALIDTGEVQTQGSSNLNEIAIDRISSRTQTSRGANLTKRRCRNWPQAYAR